MRRRRIVHHGCLADPTARIGDRQGEFAEPQLPGNAARMRGGAEEGHRRICHGPAEGPEHRSKMHRLRGGDRGIGISHLCDGDQAQLEHEIGFHAEEGWSPEDQVGELTHLDRAQMLRQSVRDRWIDRQLGGGFSSAMSIARWLWAHDARLKSGRCHLRDASIRCFPSGLSIIPRLKSSALRDYQHMRMARSRRGLPSRYQLRGGEACATLGRIRNGWMRETNFVVRPSSLSTGVYRGSVWQENNQRRSPVRDERKPIPTKRKNLGAARPTHLNKAAGSAARPMRMSLPNP